MSTQPEADLAKLVNDEINRQVDIKMQPAPSIELIVKNLNIWAEMKEGKPCRKHIVNKLILNSVSCCFKAGTATAILGSSGSGKTTLMNYIASRMEDSVLKSNGQLFVNGTSVNSIKSIKHRTAYVTQFDVLFSEMTPREQMLYSARLSGLDHPEEKVEEIIEALNLNGCANTAVGDDLHRGVSGGERKRTAVGIELITDPSLLFLDEPTTGLDSKSALDIAFMIKTLTKTGRTVISTIHSPSAEIMEQFDQVICLCRGEIVYYGPPLEINSYFGEIGYPAPPLTNPADHLMTIIHEDDIKIQALKTGKELPEEEVQALFKERINTFVSSCKASNVDPVPVQDKPISYQEVTKERIRNTTEFKNFFIVLQRCIVLYRKSPTLFRVKMFQHVGFGCFALILLHNTVSPYHNTIQAIADKGGMAFNLGATMCFAGLFASLHTFIHAIPVFKREQENKLYGPFTFYVTNSLYELPFQMVMTIIYLLMVFWVINIRHDTFWTFVRYFFLFTLTKLSSAGLGDLLALVFKKIEIVQQVNSIAVVPMFLVSGFAANVKTIAWHMIVYSYLSFFRFAFQGAINIEFDDGVRQDWIYNCRLLLPNCNDKGNDACYIRYKDHPTAVRPPACDPRTNYDFFENQYGWNLLILAGQAVFFRIFALWAVYLFVKERNVVQNEIPEDLAKVIENRRHMKYNTSPPKGEQYKQIKAVEVSPERNDEIIPLNAVSPSPGSYSVKKVGKPSENSDDPEPRF